MSAQRWNLRGSLLPPKTALIVAVLWTALTVVNLLWLGATNWLGWVMQASWVALAVYYWISYIRTRRAR
ncbi:hypothetical protein [Amycolatopsis sp. H20-H5]|uniref:hypothetical protein n=1 Tax=Amycolatopsis sp. H20-H5 TaxID=3046309 RepID=UPI002DBFA862|nr:hypothetical protein [Amycolatopsis sp. H20-H5]MEC3980867.1 hypothetical protein [Amycolatopsis sp. H20-H5]